MIHKSLTPERWFTLSAFEQLANVGTDIARAEHWRKENNKDYSDKAFDRAMELLDLTVADPKNKGGRRKELLRVREILKDYFLGDNEYGTTAPFWYQYFYDFGYAAALERDARYAAK